MRACRVDANHKEIVDHFRLLGWSVLDIHNLKNCCDIIVSKDYITIVVEIKDGSKPPSARKLTKGEQKFFSEWQGHKAIVKSVEEVDELNRIWTIWNEM